MAAQPEAPESNTTASPLDRHASPVADRPTTSGQTRHGRATAALIISILGIVFAAVIALLGLILSIIGTVLAATARSDIERRGMVGGGQAKAALICGIVGIVLNVASMAVAAALLS
jgi:hypothetical protein